MGQDLEVRMIDAYKQFVNNLKAVKRCGDPAPYGWYKLPDRIPAEWMAYGLMLDEHARELANSINELGRYISSLEAWKPITDKKDNDETLEIIIEFVRPVAILAINLPYVIRSRFIYSIAHLCHQANIAKKKDWVDDLPLDDEIFFDVADKYCALWKSYGKLKLALERISDKQFVSDTRFFRDKYTHRYSLGIEVGLTEFVRRNVGENGKVSYGIGYTEPLTIDQLLPVLSGQYLVCIKAFEKYQTLVKEHILEIK